MVATALKAEEEAWASAEEVATGQGGAGASDQVGSNVENSEPQLDEALRRQATEATALARAFLQACDECGVSDQAHLE